MACIALLYCSLTLFQVQVMSWMLDSHMVTCCLACRQSGVDDARVMPEA